MERNVATVNGRLANVRHVVGVHDDAASLACTMLMRVFVTFALQTRNGKKGKTSAKEMQGQNLQRRDRLLSFRSRMIQRNIHCNGGQ